MDLDAQPLRRVSHHRDLARQFQGLAGVAGYGGQGLCTLPAQDTGADTAASGATRVAGSVNFKNKYAPLPRVAINTAQPGCLADANELDRVGLIAAPEAVAQPLLIAPVRVSGGSSQSSIAMLDK